MSKNLNMVAEFVYIFLSLCTYTRTPGCCPALKPRCWIRQRTGHKTHSTGCFLDHTLNCYKMRPMLLVDDRLHSRQPKFLSRYLKTNVVKFYVGLLAFRMLVSNCNVKARAHYGCQLASCLPIANVTFTENITFREVWRVGPFSITEGHKSAKNSQSYSGVQSTGTSRWYPSFNVERLTRRQRVSLKVFDITRLGFEPTTSRNNL